jgi:hypothetical protein
MKAEGIRFVTRGLGGRAASEFTEVSSEDDTSDVVVHDVDQLAEGIATMVASLKSRAARSRVTPPGSCAGWRSFRVSGGLLLPGQPLSPSRHR